jgi:hypothetical protein
MTASPRSERPAKAARTSSRTGQVETDPPSPATRTSPRTAPVEPESAIPSKWQVGVRKALSAVTLAIVVLAPETVAWQALLGFAQHVLHLDGWKVYAFPLCAGAAAFYFALLSMSDVLKGDSALANRLATWAYAAGGASASVYYELTVPAGSPAAGVFFGAASLSAAWVWDRTLKAWRRNELRALGERPLPRFRLLRWALAPTQTFTAFRQSVLLELSTAQEAVAAADRVARDKALGSAPDNHIRALAWLLASNPDLTGEEACRQLNLDATDRHGRRLLEQARKLLENRDRAGEGRPELGIAQRKAS